MIIYCTKKLVKKFNVEASNSGNDSLTFFQDIYAHNFSIGKANFVIFLDSTTLFSTFYIEEQEHAMELDELFIYSLAIALECYGYEKDKIEMYLLQFTDITYKTLINPSVISTLNTKIKQFKEIFVDEINRNGTTNIEEIANLINSKAYKMTDHSHSPKSIFLNQVLHRNELHFSSQILH